MPNWDLATGGGAVGQIPNVGLPSLHAAPAARMHVIDCAEVNEEVPTSRLRDASADVIAGNAIAEYLYRGRT